MIDKNIPKSQLEEMKVKRIKNLILRRKKNMYIYEEDYKEE